jgi:DNA-binding NtrC family response regulator
MVDISSICILLVKPSEDCHKFIRDLFSEDMPSHYELDLAPSYAAALSMVQRSKYDICFAPSRIYEHDVIDLLSEMSKNERKIPVIIITDSMESRIGDADTTAPKEAYSLVEGNPSGNFLGQHIRYAMERNRVESALMRAKKEWQYILDTVPDPIAIIDQNHLFKHVNA